MSALSSATESQSKGDRICDYYLSERGCVKGSDCDFEHPVAPSGASTNKVCDYYGTQGRGCVKEATCEFLHLNRVNAQGQPTNRVCDFYLTPQGCIKGFQCDFLHPRAKPARYNLHGNGRGIAAVGVGRGGSRSVGGGARGLSLYPHTHRERKVDKLCAFFSTPEGCKKGNSCEFIHKKEKQCQYYAAGNCKKGNLCDFQHGSGQ